MTMEAHKILPPLARDGEAPKDLIARESARRLAKLGGSEPDLEVPRRR